MIVTNIFNPLPSSYDWNCHKRKCPRTKYTCPDVAVNMNSDLVKVVCNNSGWTVRHFADFWSRYIP